LVAACTARPAGSSPHVENVGLRRKSKSRAPAAKRHHNPIGHNTCPIFFADRQAGLTVPEKVAASAKPSPQRTVLLVLGGREELAMADLFLVAVYLAVFTSVYYELERTSD